MKYLLHPWIPLATAALFCSSFLFSQEIEWAEHTNFDHLSAIALESDNLWVLSSGGLVRYNVESGDATPFSSNQLGGRPHKPMVVAANSSVWMAGSEGKVFEFDGNSPKAHQLRMPGSESSGIIQSIALAPDGKVWVTMSGFDQQISKSVSYLFNYDGVEWRRISDDPQWRAVAAVEELLVDEAGQLWGRGSDPLNIKRGVILKVTPDLDIQYYTVNEGLPIAGDDSRIMDISLGPDKQVWCAGSGGIAQYENSQWIRTPREYDLSKPGLHLSPQNINVLPGKQIWVHNLNEVSRFANDQWTLYDEIPGLAGPASILELVTLPDGSAYLSTTVGLFRYDGTWRPLTTQDGIPDGPVEQVLISDDGALFAIINDLAYRIEGNNRQAYFVNNTVHSGAISDISFASESVLWVAYNCNINKSRYGSECGVGRFAENTWRLFGPEDGIEFPEVHSIAIGDDDRVWFSARGGLLLREADTWRNIRPETPDDSLLQFEAITLDSDGNIWVAYAKRQPLGFGVFKYDGATWRHFGLSEGIETRIHKLRQAPDGRMWAVADQYFDFAEEVYRGGLLSLEDDRWMTYDVGGESALSDRQQYPSNLVFAADQKPIVHVNGGLMLFDRNAGWDWLKDANDDILSKVSVLSQQSFSTIWLAGEFGLAYLEDEELRHFAPNTPVLPSTIAINENAQDIWISSKSSLFQALDILTVTDFEEVDQPLLSEEVTVFPQPLDRTTLSGFWSGQHAGPMTFSIIDLHGRCLLKDVPSQLNADGQFELNINYLAGGVYFLQLNSGRSSVVRKILLH